MLTVTPSRRGRIDRSGSSRYIMGKGVLGAVGEVVGDARPHPGQPAGGDPAAGQVDLPPL